MNTLTVATMPLDDRYSRRTSGLIVPVESEPAPAATAIDLFAGCGGMSCGFHAAGMHVIGASEWSHDAVAIYLCNLGSQTTKVYVGETAAPDATKSERAVFERFGGQVVFAGEVFEEAGTGWITHARDDNGLPIAAHPCEFVWMCDVRELKGSEMCDDLGIDGVELHCVAGGPPCQGFSMAGKRNVMDPRNSLVFEFGRLVCEIHPKTIVMENVPGILSMVTPEGVPVVDALCRILEDGDFAPFDAMRKALVGRDGAKVAYRGTAVEPETDESDQLSMEVAL